MYVVPSTEIENTKIKEEEENKRKTIFSFFGRPGTRLREQVKGTEIEALLRNVNPLCEMADEVQAHEVQMKADYLHDSWQRLRATLAERVDLIQVSRLLPVPLLHSERHAIQ